MRLPMTDEKPTLLTFPCVFPLKIFGAKSDQFEISILTIMRDFLPELDETAIQTRPSKDNKYVAITVLANVESQEQLDSIYRALTSSPLVLMVL